MALVPLPNGHLPLDNNTTYTFHLVAHDASGNLVPRPAGDVDTVTPNGAHAASLGVTVGADASGNATVALAPLVVESDAANGGGGIGLTITDSAGLVEDTATAGVMFDIIVPPPGPAVAIGVDLAGVSTAPQPPPTAPGP